MEFVGRGGRSRRRVVVVGLLALFSVLGVLATGCGAGAGPSNAGATSCGARVVQDWTDNGRIDGLYAGHCYLEALTALPEDVRTYSSAVDDIKRAMQSREAGTPKPRAAKQPTAFETDRARRLSDAEASAFASRPAATRRALPGPIVAVAALSLVVAATTSIAVGVRRARRSR